MIDEIKQIHRSKFALKPNRIYPTTVDRSLELREIVCDIGNGIVIKRVVNVDELLKMNEATSDDRSSSGKETIRDLDAAVEEWRSAVEDLIREERSRTARATARAKKSIDDFVAETLENFNNGGAPEADPTTPRTKKRLTEQELELMAEKWRSDMMKIKVEEYQRSKAVNEERRNEINNRLQNLLTVGLTEEAGIKLLEIGQRLEDVLREEKQETGRALEERDDMEVFTEMKIHQIRMAYGSLNYDSPIEETLSGSKYGCIVEDPDEVVNHRENKVELEVTYNEIQKNHSFRSDEKEDGVASKINAESQDAQSGKSKSNVFAKLHKFFSSWSLKKKRKQQSE